MVEKRKKKKKKQEKQKRTELPYDNGRFFNEKINK